MVKIRSFFLEQTKSTNTEIKKIYENYRLNDSIGLLTKIQSDGRGRGANIWKSSEGDLMCSLLIHQNFNTLDFSKLNIIISVFIINTLRLVFSNLDFKIKWPNDIFVDEKKIGGILIENSIKNNMIEYIVIGLGINIVSNPENLNYSTTKISNLTKIIKPIKIYTALIDYFEKNSLTNAIVNFEYFKEKWLRYYKDTGKFRKFNTRNTSIVGKLHSISNDGKVKIITKCDTVILNF